MLRLVYSCIPRLPSADCLFEMAYRAQRHHRARHCCGLIYYDDMRFVHFVEGPNSAVLDYSELLKRDIRHYEDWQTLERINTLVISPTLALGLLDRTELPLSSMNCGAERSVEVMEDLLVAAQVKYSGSMNASVAVQDPLADAPVPATTGCLPDPA